MYFHPSSCASLSKNYVKKVVWFVQLFSGYFVLRKKCAKYSKEPLIFNEGGEGEGWLVGFDR